MTKSKGIRSRTTDEWFWSRVEKSEECWKWVGHFTPGGYGKFCHNYKYYSAHRYSYELHIGKIPDSLVLDHLCRNKLCVNPQHLEAVTVRENTIRGNTVLKKLDLPVGVIKVKNRYRARKWFNGKSINLGYFKTIEEAHSAYKEGKYSVV